MRTVLIFLFFLSGAPVLAGRGDVATLWLPIVSTQISISDALTSAGKIGHNGEEFHLIETNDCHNLRNDLYIVVAGVHETRAAAESAITKWRKRGITDAYLRRCEVVVPSRLSLGIPLVDPSFMHQPIKAVNWDIENAISRVVPIRDGLVVLIIPRHKEDPEDIREGLRIGVHLYRLDTERLINLSSDCIDPEFVFNTTHIAITCVNEAAATHLLHRTQLYTLADGQIVADESRCTMPVFKQGRWVCQKESVDAEGILELKPAVLNLNQPSLEP